MAKDKSPDDPPRGYTTEDVAATPAPLPKRNRHWKLKGIGTVLVLLPLAVIALWTWITISYTYSAGERVGYVQKFSKKGWLCHTWEGELPMVIPNQAQVVPEVFKFTVRSDSIARAIQAAEGRRVSLGYKQHRGIPFTCFGETQYFVDGVRVVGTQ
ncbi:MAG: hypothetical protein ABJD07_14200 [Gemmatimonadaceae bacterium]